MIVRADVDAARDRIAGRIRRTPMLAVDDAFGGSGWFKLEYLQHTGSFKARGAFNRILAAVEDGSLDRSVGVVTASGGNAGLAHAFAAGALGVPATVYVPTLAPAVKIERLRDVGAEVVVRGAEFAVAHQGAVDHVASTGALYCHAYDQPEIAAGAGTLGLEILDDAAHDPVDTVLVAVGGGGLLAGVAAALEGHARVIGVEPRTIPTLNRALAAGGPTDVEVSGVAADSLGARRLGEIAYEVAARTGVQSVLVDDADIVAARRLLWEDYRIVVEHGAATALAALTSGAYRPADGERVVVVLCGANTDITDLSTHGTDTR